MNFKKLPKEKRNQLILVVLVTIAALVGLGYGLIKSQYSTLGNLAARKQAAQQKLRQMEDKIKRADLVQAELAADTKKLAELENGMAPSGDLYAWAIDTVRQLKLAYKLDIPQVNQPVRGDVTVLPKFPYKQATLTLNGTAYFHDVGTFLAAFENQFPYSRVVNLSLEPASSAVTGEKEKLAFRMDIVTLVKLNPS
jgi:Tfp pilus assembly protein PilO